MNNRPSSDAVKAELRLGKPGEGCPGRSQAARGGGRGTERDETEFFQEGFDRTTSPVGPAPTMNTSVSRIDDAFIV